MKKTILSIMALAAVTVSGVSAQNSFLGWTFGPKVGINVANLSNVDDNKALVGFTGGGFVEYGFVDWFSLSADVLYSRQGVKFKDITTGAVNIIDQRETLDYLNFPIMANFYVLRGFAIRTGLQPGFLLGANNHRTVGGTKSSLSVTDNRKTFDLTIPIALSYSFDFGLVLDARYGFGLTNVNDFDNAANSKNCVFTVTAGWRF